MVVLFHPAENTDSNPSLSLLQAACLADKAGCCGWNQERREPHYSQNHFNVKAWNMPLSFGFRAGRQSHTNIGYSAHSTGEGASFFSGIYGCRAPVHCAGKPRLARASTDPFVHCRVGSWSIQSWPKPGLLSQKSSTPGLIMQLPQGQPDPFH